MTGCVQQMVPDQTIDSKSNGFLVEDSCVGMNLDDVEQDYFLRNYLNPYKNGRC